MLSDITHQPVTKVRVSAIVPIEARGRHELLRLAAALGSYLQPDIAAALAVAARNEHITPAYARSPRSYDLEQGVVARVEGRELALGSYSFLVQVGVVPKLAELHAARHIEARSGVALYLAILDEARCVGIVGVETVQQATALGS